MTLIKKILSAIGLGVILTILYYYMYAYFQIWFEDLCKKNYCIEFFPIGDLIACYIAIVGLYFVVTSLDAWKHQDQYQTAKQNIKLLHDIYKKLEIYNAGLARIEDRSNSLRIVINSKKNEETIKHTGLFYKYSSWISETNIEQLIQTADYEITQQNKNLYQKDFNNLINLAHNYVITIDSKINSKDKQLIDQKNAAIQPIKADYDKKLKFITEDDILIKISQEYLQKIEPLKKYLTQNDIDTIHTQEHLKFDKFQSGLSALQKKLNEYIK